MKNTIKMSLVAAVAVAGLTTSASAGNLEEMIIGVSAKGQINVAFQNDDSKSKTDGVTTKTSSNDVEYDLDITFKMPVNDMITATLGMEADHDVNVDTRQATRDKFGTNGNAVNITVANFTYANGPVTAIVGKQTVATPFTYDQKVTVLLHL